MKAKLEARKYQTRKIGRHYYTAAGGETIASITNGAPEGSSTYICETLKQTRGGCWYLHAQGGSGSRYGQIDAAGHPIPGERLIPLTEEQAQRWAAEVLPAAAYDRAMCPQIGAGPMRVVSVYLPAGTRRWLRARVQRVGQTVSGQINEALDAYIAAHRDE